MVSRISLVASALAAAFLVMVTVEVLVMGADYAILKMAAFMIEGVGLLESGWAASHDGDLAIAALALAAPVALWVAAGCVRRGLVIEATLARPVGRAPSANTTAHA
jgi:hypothetical protein